MRCRHSARGTGLLLGNVAQGDMPSVSGEEKEEIVKRRFTVILDMFIIPAIIVLVAIFSVRIFAQKFSAWLTQ